MTETPSFARLEAIASERRDLEREGTELVLTLSRMGVTHDRIAEAYGMTQPGISKMIKRENERVARPAVED